MSGSLGGFHVFDITPEEKRHQRLFSVGQDFSHNNIPYHTFTTRDMYKTCNESTMFDDSNFDTKAFTFEFRKPLKSSNISRSCSPCLDSSSMDSNADSIVVNLKVASLCYTHSPATLHQLSQCVSEFKEYKSSVAKSLKNVANEVAMGMVAKRSDVSQTGLFGSSTSLDNFSKYRSNLSLDRTEMEYLDYNTFNDDPEKKSPKIMLDVSFESPIIVVPKSATSSQVLVAHLGQISLSNRDNKGQVNYMEEVLAEQSDNKKTDRVFLEVRKMNLYSVDIDKNAQYNSSAMGMDGSFRYASININTDIDTPIMFDTTVQVTIDHTPGSSNIINATQDDFLAREIEDTLILQDVQPLVDIRAKIQTPVKLVLQKNVYEQILQTSDYLSSVEAKLEPSTSSSSLNHNSSEDSTPTKAEEPGYARGPFPGPSSDSSKGAGISQVQDKVSYLCKKFKLEVPVFIVELRGDFDEGQKGMVDLKLHEFVLDMFKDNAATTKVDLSLKSIVMEDLLQDPESNYRKIVVSKDANKEDLGQMKPREFMSHSCPDNAIIAPVPMMPHSLPTSFHDNLSRFNKPIISKPLISPYIAGLARGRGKLQKKKE